MGHNTVQQYKKINDHIWKDADCHYSLVTRSLFDKIVFLTKLLFVKLLTTKATDKVHMDFSGALCNSFVILLETRLRNKSWTIAIRQSNN